MGKEGTDKAQLSVEPKRAGGREIGFGPPQDGAHATAERAATRFVYRSSEIAPSQETSIWLG